MPPLSTILRWLDAHGAYVLALLPALVVAWKAMPAATRARLELAFPRLVGLVRFIAAVAPDVLGAARIARYQVVAGEPRAGVTPPAAVPPAPIAPRGFARTDVLAWGALAAAMAFTAVALSGCPTWVRPACGAPGAYSCVANQPHVCSPSGALTPVGDQPCSRVGGSCVLSDAGVAHCARGDQ